MSFTINIKPIEQTVKPYLDKSSVFSKTGDLLFEADRTVERMEGVEKGAKLAGPILSAPQMTLDALAKVSDGAASTLTFTHAVTPLLDALKHLTSTCDFLQIPSAIYELLGGETSKLYASNVDVWTRIKAVFIALSQVAGGLRVLANYGILQLGILAAKIPLFGRLTNLTPITLIKEVPMLIATAIGLHKNRVEREKIKTDNRITLARLKLLESALTCHLLNLNFSRNKAVSNNQNAEANKQQELIHTATNNYLSVKSYIRGIKNKAYNTDQSRQRLNLKLSRSFRFNDGTEVSYVPVKEENILTYASAKLGNEDIQLENAHTKYLFFKLQKRKVEYVKQINAEKKNWYGIWNDALKISIISLSIIMSAIVAFAVPAIVVAGIAISMTIIAIGLGWAGYKKYQYEHQHYVMPTIFSAPIIPVKC
ncbi:MAG: hypothetical protein BGO10_07115 [Chlamydia sp. 32-24]|nr:MAG: hypothetical protein BGO10_07115 [Chlamydia sp. 32-24]